MTTLAAAWSAGRSEKRERRRVPLSFRLARWAGKALPRWKKVRSTVTTLAGYGFVNFAVFQVNTIAGWATVGVSLFLIDALSGSDK